MIWENLAVILLGAAVACYEVPGLLKRQRRGELIAFSVFLLFGLALAVSMILHLPVPNPTRGIEILFSPITRWLYPEH